MSLVCIHPLCIAAERQCELMYAIRNMDQEELEWIEREYMDTTQGRIQGREHAPPFLL